MKPRWSAVAIILLAVAGALASGPQSKPLAGSETPTPSPPAGKRAFAARCAGCHGLDGRGGERAPNIASDPQVQQRSDLELQRIVSNGRPDFGMPAFRLIGPTEIKKLVGYLRTLQGGGRAAPIRGDAQKGRLLFAKAGCSSCHRVRDEGGLLGPDLSTFADGLPATELRRAITNPDPRSAAQSKLAVVRTRSGETFTGAIRNEDNFSLQLQTSDGLFHFLAKADLESLEHQPQPSMPADYGERFSPRELDDLVSYLHTMQAGEDAPAPSEDQQ